MKSKNDEILAIEQEQRRLADLQKVNADRLAQLRKEPESVKPKVRMSYYDADVVTLEFDTKEQAEKAKAILEKMEFGDCPFQRGDTFEYERRSGWSTLGHNGISFTWSDENCPWAVAAWRHGALRKA